MVAVRVNPPDTWCTPVTVTVAVCPFFGRFVVRFTCVLLCPAGTVARFGTGTANLSLLVRSTRAPPAGAGLVSVITSAVTLPPATMEIWSRVGSAEMIYGFGRGLGAARAGDLTLARAEIDRLKQVEKRMAERGDKYWAGQSAIHAKTLEGVVAHAEGRILPGDVLLMEAIGGGLAWGAAVMRW